MNRNGKIARLPHALRNLLNLRLHNGEPHKKLVAWLNTLPEVHEVLEEYFDARPITAKNLSEWKKGGYQDWLQHRDTLDWARLASDEASELDQDTTGVPLSDRLAARATIAVMKLIRKLESGSLEKPAEMRRLLEAVRVLTAQRECDQRAARLRMDLQRWKDEEADLERKARHRSLWGPINELQQSQNLEHYLQKATTGMTEEQARTLRAQLHLALPGTAASAAAPPGPSGVGNLSVSGFAKLPAPPSRPARPGSLPRGLRLPGKIPPHPGKSG